MKKLLTLVVLLCSISAYSQRDNIERHQTFGSPRHKVVIPGALSVDSIIYLPYRDTFFVNKPTNPGGLTISPIDKRIYLYDTLLKKWIPVAGEGYGSNFDDSFNATTPSTSTIPGLEGVTLGTTDITSTLQELIYPKQVPTFVLTGGVNQELMAPGANLSYTLNWTAGRQTSTDPIDAVVVNGVNQTFTNPPPMGSTSGTQSVSIPRNTNTTISGYAEAGGKVTNASTTFNFLPRRLWGWVSDTSTIKNVGSDAQLLGKGSDLDTSRVKTWNTGSPSGAQFFFYAYRADANALTSFKMNGFEALAAMSTITRNVTTSTGYVGSYIIYWTKQSQNTSSNIEAQ